MVWSSSAFDAGGSEIERAAIDVDGEMSGSKSADEQRLNASPRGAAGADCTGRLFPIRDPFPSLLLPFSRARVVCLDLMGPKTTKIKDGFFAADCKGRG